MRLLLFAGTTEGRLLAEELSCMPGLDVSVCVATEYGRELLEELSESAQTAGQLTLITGRLAQGEMEDLMQKDAFDLVVDATHPYATMVTANIQAAAEISAVPYLRLVREQSEECDYQYCASVQEAAEVLSDTTGNVLVTTGVKELHTYTSIPDFAQRLYVRVLPTTESIGTCEELGFSHSHIIAMQGPFSAAFNKAVIEQFAIAWMVTKDGGIAGGFAEKIQAATELGVKVLVIGRPVQETGLTFEQVVTEVSRRVEETM